MPTVLASQIIGQAALLLADDTNVRWTEAELLGWLNAGQREVVVLRPSANPKTVVSTLVAGTRQALPSDGHVLVRITRNMGVGGTTPGRVVRPTNMDVLDQQSPLWHSESPSTTIRQYMYDIREPLAYYVYPPATAGATLEVTYSAPPNTIVSAANTITINDMFANALLDYVLFRAYAKDGEHPANASRAAAYRQSFENSLGLGAQADGAAKPTPEDA